MNLGKMKVVQMRKELEDRGLDKSGTRPVLMKRLREALSRENATPAAALTHLPAKKVREREPVGKPLPTTEREVERQDMAPCEERPSEPRDETPQPREMYQEADPDVSREMEREQGGEGLAGESEARPLRQEEGSAAVADVVEMPKGNLAVASKANMDERLRKRRERFGAVERAAVGVETGGRTQPAGTDDVKRLEEIKRRRLAKFGPVEVKPGAVGRGAGENISPEERERRLKRQRRFESVGKATTA